jgi:hypothetical protein
VLAFLGANPNFLVVTIGRRHGWAGLSVLSPPLPKVAIPKGSQPEAKERYAARLPEGKRAAALTEGMSPIRSEAMRMAVKLPPNRRLCGTDEAAALYGCTVSHIRGMAQRKEIWTKRISDRVYVYDADEIERLALERDKLRAAGKLCGRRPRGRKTA